MTPQNYILDFLQTKFSFPKELFIPLLERGIGLLKKQPHLKGKLQGGKIEIAFVDDKKIRLMNQKYRGKNKPTDVISLSYFEAEELEGFRTGTETWLPKKLDPSQNLVGEVFISIDTARRQAREHQKTLPEELQFLFAHGLLHIFGYDHETVTERKVMFDLQDKILGTKKWRKVAEEPFKL